MTSIEWTEKTWNPIAGCTVVSPGCTNCYAMKQAPRLAANPATPQYAGTVQNSKGGPVWTGKIGIASDSVLTQPLHRKKPTMYFVNSMSDLFHENVPDEVIDRIFAVMALCPQHTFQVLTKRADRMRDYMLERWQGTVAMEIAGVSVPAGPETGRMHQVEAAMQQIADDLNLCDPDNDALYDENERCIAMKFAWPLPNVWLGVSVEDHIRADERIPHLLNTPAAVRFISAEPLLGAVDLGRWLATALITCKDCEEEFWLHNANPCQHAESPDGWTLACPNCGGCKCINRGPKGSTNMGIPYSWHRKSIGRFTHTHPTIELLPCLDWVIVGGESGPNARPMHPDWARSLRDQCVAVGVPFFFKQWGQWISEIDRDKDDTDWRGNYSKAYTFAYAILNLEGGTGFHGDRVHLMKRTTKAKAGRLLDGRVWDEMPGDKTG